MDLIKKESGSVVEQFMKASLLQSNSQNFQEVLSILHKKQVNIAEKMIKAKKRKPRSMKFYIHSPLQKVQFKNYEHLHTLWKSYIAELLTDCRDAKTMQELLLKADLHGAMLRVVQSKSARVKGLCGIVIAESKNMFQLLTSNDRIIKVAKKNSVFEIIYLQFRITIFGNQFCIKPGFRLTKKYSKYIPTLSMV